MTKPVQKKTRKMKSEDILISCSAARITQIVRQCPTKTGPVARYVELPVDTNNKPILIQKYPPRGYN